MAAAQAVEAPADPWGAAWSTLAPTDGTGDATSWTGRRADLGLGTAPWGAPGFDAPRLVDSALRLNDGGYLAQELALLDAAAAAGLLEPSRAASARAPLAELARGALDAPAFTQRVAQFDLRARGSLLALLPPECLVGPAMSLDDVARAAAAELAVPAWRVASVREALPVAAALPPDLAAAGGLLARARRPETPPVLPADPARCWFDGLELLAVLGELDVEQRAAVLPALQTLGEVLELPGALAVTLASRAYLEADEASLALASRWAAGHGAAPFVEALALSARTADGDGPQVLGPVADALPPASDAFEHWVHGELLRRAQRAEAALQPLNAAVSADPWFANALLSRSSALVALGRGHDALADLQYLREIYPGSTPYARLIDALDRRLR